MSALDPPGSGWRGLSVADVATALTEVKGTRPLPRPLLEAVAQALQVRDDRPVQLAVQRRQLGAIGVVGMTMSAIRVSGLEPYRSNTVHIGFVLKGSVTMTPREGTAHTLVVGEAFMITNWSAFDVVSGDDTHVLHILIGDARLRERGVRVRAARFRLEGPRSLVSPVLALCLAVIEPDWEPTASAVRVSERAMEDLVVGLLMEIEDHDLDQRDLRAQLRRRTLEEIALRHHDPALSPVTLSKQLGVSLRHLQRGFENSGTTVAEQIARHRAESAAMLLSAPGGTALTVAEVARAAGFSSAYELRSALRAHFGVLPTQIRGTATGIIAPEGEQFRADASSPRGRGAIVS